MRKLLVLGAGPKALALLAKARCLKEAGFDGVPDIVVFDTKQAGAHWSGAAGYTDGNPPLDTPPEKDLGFPYSCSFDGENDRTIDRAMIRFSWTSFLVATGELAGWVDRGRRLPKLKDWAAYLVWAARELGPIRTGESVTKLVADSRGWTLHLKKRGRPGAFALTVPSVHAFARARLAGPSSSSGQSTWVEGLRSSNNRV